MQSGWAIGALIAAALSSVVLERYGWRMLFLFGALPAIAAFLIRRGVEEPALWRERKQTKTKWIDIFAPAYLRRVIIATLVASSVLIAYWGLVTWLPTFLASPVSEGGAGLTITKSARWLILLQTGAFIGYVSFGWIADRIGRRPAFTLFMIGATASIPAFVLGARSPATLLLIGPLVGYFAHGYFSVFGAMLAELFPTNIRASAQGFCYNAGRMASAVVPILIGSAAPKYGLGVPLAADAVFFALGAVLIWLLPETRGAALSEAPA
jgi:MFS family permease